MRLSTYRHKRRFERTPEPRGGRPAARAAPIFVVQLHHASHRHYDFRLQVGGALRSWAVPKGPSFDPTVKRLAMEVEDHPLEYAKFEGIIPAGNYGAGDVLIFDRGTWSTEGDARAQLDKGHLRFELLGEKLRGRWDLIRTARDRGRAQWLLRKVDDGEAGPFEADDLIGDPERRKPPTAVWRSSRPARSAARGDGAEVKLTHGERVVYPELGVTKGEVFDYYRAVAPHLLPGIARRPLALLRCPDGAAGTCFFQKHNRPALGSHVHDALIRGGEKLERYLYVEDEAGLLELVQMNAIELHPWATHVADPDVCDRMIFDLDPADDVPWSRVVEVARVLRRVLDGAGLVTFPRLSGGKGVHVVAPLAPAAPFERVREFAARLASAYAAARPGEIVDVMTKRERAGKIFVDYLRNVRGATCAASYSLRRQPAATVAMPIGWNELGRVSGPRAFDLRSALRHLARRRRDPWAELDTLRQALPQLGPA